MSLTINVKNASDLPNQDTLGKSDPYVSICFQGEKKRTGVKSGTLDPVWNEELIWNLGIKAPRNDEVIDILVKDYERLGRNKLMGRTNVPLRNLLHGGSLDVEQVLLDENNQPTTGRLAMTIQFAPPLGTAVPGNVGLRSASEDALGARDPQGPIVANTTSNLSGNLPDTGFQAYQRSLVPSMDVVTKFQIRIRIVEARQLFGEDIRPVCRVSCCGKTQQTKTLRGGMNPWFNELFFFQKEVSPKELLENFIEFRVCNSRVLRSESVIGTFKCEICQIYNSPEHAIINKWFVLSHPDEQTPTVQGYLKGSIAILGPGDSSPSMDASNNDLDDIERNLLWSAGVHLQPAYFTLSIYCAQNLPRMDSGTMQKLKEVLGFGKASKELVDPYVVASFAGNEVQSRIHYTDDNPEFKQEICIGFLFPSMCNTLKITLMDWDRVGNDDIIGTVCIPIHSISAPGDDGYLPTFGPTYLPVYGARRAWELWDGEKIGSMNEGKVEGCSYRGRILVALKTHVGSYPPTPNTDMDDLCFNKIRRFRSTRGFVVMAMFSHAYLLKEANRPYELEVSMGNFGNKMENAFIPSPSSSHPSNPLYDGCKYYFLPWGESFPLITVQCQWEDISHRLFASNAICRIAEKLKTDLTNIRSYIPSKIKENETRGLIKQTLKNLQLSCNIPLPHPEPVRNWETELDIELSGQRMNALLEISHKVEGLDSLDAKLVIEELELILSKLEDLVFEPQISMPDVFLWLMSGTERIAYTRIPAQDIIASNKQAYKGKISGKFNSFPLLYPGESSRANIGGIVRASVMFGREDELASWWEDRSDLQLTVFAETYENEVILAPGSGKWTNKGSLMRRPSFSDADGLNELPKTSFIPCEGWKFQGDWTIDPDPSVKFSTDEGHTVYCEEVFQQQARVPGGTWIDAPTTWADVRGDPVTPRDELECHAGWKWRDLWTVDLQRAVDSEGWEYKIQKGLTGWSPQEKLYHLIRRRRWTRERQRVAEAQEESSHTDGWEYSSMFSSRFHVRERTIDVVRRRRWRRKLIPSVEGIPPTPRILVKSGEDKDDFTLITCPRQYVISTEVYLYQLRAYIYQARNLEPADKSGLSDPYAIVNFCGLSQQTEKQSQTLSPTWDQTIMFDDVKLCGHFTPPSGVSTPPAVVMEIYDWDARGEPDFIGRVLCDPDLIDPLEEYRPPKLRWYDIQCSNSFQGELLAAFELICKSANDLPHPPPQRGDLFMVPIHIRPLLRKTRIEILCWGLRNMAAFELQAVTRPSVLFECGGRNVTSSIMKNTRRNPNFDDPHLVFDVDLPSEEIYQPPLTIHVIDHRPFGSKPVVASAAVMDLNQYNVDFNLIRKEPPLLDCLKPLKKMSSKEETQSFERHVDWWAKYYASIGDIKKYGLYLEKGYKTLEIIKGTLEDDPRFNRFTDFVDTLPLYRGKGANSAVVGEFKGTFRIYPILPGKENGAKVLSGFPSPNSQEILARIYVISARDLAPKDSGSTSDPYLVISLGKNRIKDRKNYKAKTLSPSFASMYELKGTLPMVKDLVIQVWDKDVSTSDDLIGETTIDLENRFLSRFRATVGLPKQYHVSGCNAWRDYKLPSEILQELLKERNLEGPFWSDDSSLFTIGDCAFSLAEFESEDLVIPKSVGGEKERLSLHVLNNAFSLVPEHIESRPLYHPARPRLPQGTIQMWVDLFPAGIATPTSVDISPRTPTKFVLRICIYNVYDVPLQESNVAGEKMSDVYVIGWLQGLDDVQRTDIHYRCLDGEGNFNWRFVFELEFLEAEQMMLLKKKSVFSSKSSEELRPPSFILQIWDNDFISRDDYLSEMTLNLCHLKIPSKSKSKARGRSPPSTTTNGATMSDGVSTLIQLNHVGNEAGYVNLFEVKRVSGYFPFTRAGKSGTFEVAGILEAEMEILTEEEAKLRPAGQGRDKPNANPTLKEPNRPQTSFFWLASPWKSFRHVVWKKYRWQLFTFIILFALFLFVFLFLYSLPSASMNYIFSPK